MSANAEGSAAAPAPADPVVTDNPDSERFEVRVNGAVAGFAMYHRIRENRNFTHTEIDSAFEGQGLGSTLIQAALDATRADGLGVIPHCPFVKRFIGRHPDYLDLVPEERREEFGLQA